MSQEQSVKTLSGVQRLLEGSLIIFCAIAAYVLVALSSFHASDPGWSQTNFNGEILNLTGAVGAWVADVLLYFFGYAAYLIPVIIALTGWLLFKRIHRLLEVDYFSVGLRLIGFLLVVFGLSSLASMNADNIYEFSAGGVAGDIISQAMLPYFNPLGTTLLLLCFVGAGFTLLTGISWLTVVDGTGAATIWLFTSLFNLPEKFKSSGDTEDTQGFMSVVERFKRKRERQDLKAPEVSESPTPNQPALSEVDSVNPEVKTSRFFNFRNKKNDEQPLVSKQDAKGAEPEETEQSIKAFSKTKIGSSDEIRTFTRQQNQLAVNDVINEPVNEVVNKRIEPQLSAVPAIDIDTDDAIEPSIQTPWQKEQLQDDSESERNATSHCDITGIDNSHTDNAIPAITEAVSHEAKIVDGVVILPGQTQAEPTKPMDPLPSISLLDIPDRKKNPITQEELEQIGKLVEVKLADFNIIANVVGVYPGPVITRFELELAPGVKASKISNLSTDLARSLLSESVRVVEVIPGKPYIGLELPNKFRETVFMRDVLDCEAFRDNPSHLSMVLGQDIGGQPVVVDLGKMPHLLVAGTTGSGKSVGVNVMITSLLYKSGPDDVRFIMIDPKMLELSVYEGIPHLLCEVVTDMKEAANSLRWCVGEMERRYKLLSALGVRNLKGYNAKIKEALERGEPILDPLWKASDSMEPSAPALEKLPSIVVIVDEFADMMMIVGKKVEELIARIAQKARAAGIHLILATQRPSVDVITGLIKANIPTRMAFQVSSKIDSRTILDQQGAETLLGMGDMLYQPPGSSIPVRIHGAFVDDHEVHNVVADWHARGKPQYIDEILKGSTDGEQVLLPGESSETDDDTDALYDEAVAFVTQSRRGSISSVQRKFKIGYNRAARIIEQMEMQGVVSAQGSNGNREVLAPPPPKDFI